MTEPNREAPDFGVVIIRGTSRHLLPEPDRRLAFALQDVYDIAVNSMDFGSGFLSSEEIAHLRELGSAIGAEPLHYKCSTSKYSYELKRSIETGCVCGALDYEK